jgi:Ca2+-binding EF-hand superfamily protein
MGILDDNMDGKIELAELKGGDQGPVSMLKKYFALIDTNHDGALDSTELANAAKLLPKRGPAKAATEPAAGAPAVAGNISKAAPAASR